jgi:hypothetical protein
MSNNGSDDFQTFFSNAEPAEHEVNFEIKAFLNIWLSWLEGHEQEVHDGERCEDERANLIAFIAHKIGMSPEAWDHVVEMYDYYQRKHEEHDAGT